MKIQVVPRPNGSLAPARPSFPSRCPIPYIIPSDPLLPLSPRSALFPSSPIYPPTQQQRTVLSLILNSIAVLWDNRIDTSLLRVDDLRPFDSRVQTSAKEPASVRLRNHACFDLPRGTPLLGEHFGAPKASDEHVGRKGGTFRPSSDGKHLPFPVMLSASSHSAAILCTLPCPLSG